jgi:hypothetical protein
MPQQVFEAECARDSPSPIEREGVRHEIVILARQEERRGLENLAVNFHGDGTSIDHLRHGRKMVVPFWHDASRLKAHAVEHCPYANCVAAAHQDVNIAHRPEPRVTVGNLCEGGAFQQQDRGRVEGQCIEHVSNDFGADCDGMSVLNPARLEPPSCSLRNDYPGLLQMNPQQRLESVLFCLETQVLP